MANYTYNRKTVDKLNVKGTLSEDLSKISCTDKDGNDFDVMVRDCLEHFSGELITFSITLSKDEDLLDDDI